MAFIINEEKRVNWPVVINEPVNGGKIQRRKIDIEFLVENDDDWTESGESIEEVLMRVVVGWAGVQERDKTPVAFNDDNLKALLILSYARVALWAAYTGEVLPGAPSKN